MSLLPSATFATSITPGPGPSDYATNALWATNGSAGPGGGVTQLVAGANITLNPPTGDGVVTITASGGGAGGVTSVTSGGPGITCTPTTGAVVVDNTGVTQLVAGTAMTVSGATGSVTVNNAGVTSLVAGSGIAVSGATGAVTVSTSGFPVFPTIETFTYVGGGTPVTFNVTSNAFRILFDFAAGANVLFNAGVGCWINNGTITLSNPAWTNETIVMAIVGGAPSSPGAGLSQIYHGGIPTCGGSGTTRKFFISGTGSLPTQLNYLNVTGDEYVRFLVFQTAP